MDLLFQTPSGLTLLSLALAASLLGLSALLRLRRHHPAAWRKEVRRSASILFLRPSDQWRLFGFFMTGEYRGLGDAVLTRLGVWQRVAFLLAVAAMVWCGSVPNGGKL